MGVGGGRGLERELGVGLEVGQGGVRGRVRDRAGGV